MFCQRMQLRPGQTWGFPKFPTFLHPAPWLAKPGTQPGEPGAAGHSACPCGWGVGRASLPPTDWGRAWGLSKAGLPPSLTGRDRGCLTMKAIIKKWPPLSLIMLFFFALTSGLSDVRTKKANFFGLRYCILPCIMCTFCPNFLGENKDAHYTWVEWLQTMGIVMDLIIRV